MRRCADSCWISHTKEYARPATIPDGSCPALYLVLHVLMKVHFNNVGRNKRSWTSEFSKLTTDQLAEEARNKGGLMSSEVDVELNDTASAGVVLVGGWRSVGTLTIEH